MSDENSTGVFQDAIENFLGPILPLLKDPTISEILINGPSEIFIEKDGKLQKTTASFVDEDALRAAVNNIAQSVGRRIDNERPTLDARLPDGSRIHAVLPPCARNGTTVSVRKFLKTNMEFKDYIKRGFISADGAQFLDILMYLGKNILVSGGTGSGKTTLLSVLCERIPRGQRLIVIEDASELDIQYEHVVSFETRMAGPNGEAEMNMRDLLKSSLRLRPDRIVVGEVRGAEAMELISAMNTGHKGCLGTIHANSPHDAAVRLEALATGAEMKISERAIQQQISSAINCIIQISRFMDGSRRVTSIAEMRGLQGSAYQIIPIFEIRKGQLEPTGEIPTFIEEMESHKIPFPRSKFQRAA